MLKNFKVTTKLVAILVAPVVVLIALAYVGVNQRLSDANAAKRVQQLTEFAGTNADLMNELELESVYSAQVGASLGAHGKDQEGEAPADFIGQNASAEIAAERTGNRYRQVSGRIQH